MANKIKVSIMGGTGYAAAELVRRLVKHPHVEILRISSIDHVGKNIGEVHRNFGTSLPYIFEDLTSEQVAAGADLVFLCLPHKVSFLKVPELIKCGVRIIDFSGDYRTKDVNEYNKYYKCEHTNPENLDKFVYGLPELNREKIRKAQYVANPGCFPTGLALSLLPLANAGLLKGKIRAIAPTGSSGSGVYPSESTHHPIRARNLKSYRPLQHQHQPEMEQTLREAGGKDICVDFIPMSVPTTRGILTNAIVDVDPSVTPDQITKIYQDYYKNSPCVRVVGPKKEPEVVNIAGTNTVEVGWYLREPILGTRSFAAMCAIDNLVRGASGQAIQNMNLMFGIEEQTGLDDFGIWP